MKQVNPTPLLLAFLLSCGQEVVEQKETIRPVRVTEVLSSGGRQSRTFSGSAKSGLASKLSFRVRGTIESLDVKLGDRVRKGDVIARLETEDYQLQVDEAEASLQQAQAQSRNSAANYERIRDLWENNNVSINDLDAARAATESASAQLQSIAKRLERVRIQLSYTQLSVPIDGSIAAVLAEANENVAAGQVIVNLNAGSRPETVFVVPEQLITEIREGDKAQVHFDSIPDKVFAATITEVGVATGSLASTYPVTARLDDPNLNVRQGMATEVTMVFGKTGNRARIYVVPKAVVDGRFVFVAEPTGDGLARVVRKEVKLGKLSVNGFEIQEGLSEGELLITAGTRFLEDGKTVALPAAAQE